MTDEQTLLVVEFARACKTAARSVALYPPFHPAIRAALARIVGTARRLTAAGDLTLAITPDRLTIDGRQASRHDCAIADLAQLLHGRMVGALRIGREADGDDWHALLVQLARPAEDVIAEGGLGRAWARAGRSHFEIHDIDYAEILRERRGAAPADWDRIVAFCRRADRVALDEPTIAALLDALSEPERFAALLRHLDQAPAMSGASLGARTAALLQLLEAAVLAARNHGLHPDAARQTLADAAAHLPPDLLAGLLAYRHGTDDDAQLAAAIALRMSDDAISAFVARAIAAEVSTGVPARLPAGLPGAASGTAGPSATPGASTMARGEAIERLAQAFAALVRDDEHRHRVLALAHDRAAAEHEADPEFEQRWQTAADMLRSYSDRDYVPLFYARELLGARARALDVEQVADDPPERIAAWLRSVSDAAVDRLDVLLLRDLLRVEWEPERWAVVAATAADEVERRVRLGAVDEACSLAEELACAAADPSRPAIAESADVIRNRIASGSVVGQLLHHLRAGDDRAAEPFVRLGAALGPSLVRPLADALTAEPHPRAIRRLRKLLLRLGAAGRDAVEQLKASSNPAARRTAIDVLRIAGGDDAVPELAAMLDDADPQVQREAIRAIVVIGTSDAYTALETELVSRGTARDSILQQLLTLRDPKAIPLLCHVLEHTAPRGAFAQTHAAIVEALGHAGEHPQATRVLRDILYGGSWLAPFRTAMLRRAAAIALHRIGSTDTLVVLAEAARCRSLGVRSAVGACPMLLMRHEERV